MIFSKAAAILLALFTAVFVGTQAVSTPEQADMTATQNETAATQEAQREITVINPGDINDGATDSDAEATEVTAEVIEEEFIETDLTITDIETDSAANDADQSVDLAQSETAEYYEEEIVTISEPIVHEIVEEIPASEFYVVQDVSGTASYDAQLEAISWQIIELTNAYRVANGLHPLQAAVGGNTKAHADWMAANEVLQHTTDRTVGENVALAYTDSLDAAEVMGRWKASPGHNANLLNARYQTIEVWCSHGSTGYSYCAQQFRY